VHAVYPIDGDADLLDPALAALRAVAASESDEWPIEAKPQTIQVSEVADGRDALRARKLRAGESLAAARRMKRR
jgi:hypothetical protein